nr:glycoside hydrolase family 27 protein [Candidatus Sigynarchaeota archaeon]
MDENFGAWARTPPMGWNSWDCFGAAVTETEVRANADYMAEHLVRFGWEYIVVDIAWYNPGATGYPSPPVAMAMDEFGRLLPAPNRFPSAADGKGFRPLADEIHAKGLKFGIHIMRGVPRLAVQQNCPIHDSTFYVADIADLESRCHWNHDMYGIDMAKPGAQEYLDSLLQLYAAWGVDYIKLDDATRVPYHEAEIAGYRKAIDRSGRRIVFSLSPGPSPIKRIEHLRANANLFRISFDVWDNWWQLRLQFYLCARWARFIQEGHWPDADMLPFGHIRVHASTHGSGSCSFSAAEQRALMTLYVIFKSPLMFGGHMPDNDPSTLSLLTNPNVLYMHRNSTENRALYTRIGSAAWTARDQESGDIYIAFFNFWRHRPLKMTISAKAVNVSRTFTVRDVWAQRDLGTCDKKFTSEIEPHGTGLYKLHAAKLT